MRGATEVTANSRQPIRIDFARYRMLTKMPTFPPRVRLITRFSRFVSSRKLGTLRPNLWEVTYIDHIPHGTVWNSLADLPRVFPGLFGSGECANGQHE